MTEEIQELLPRGIALMDGAEYAAAAELFRECLVRDPRDAEGYFYLGEALAEMHLLEEAVEVTEAGLKLKPEDAEAWTSLGDLYFESGRHKEALANYRRVLELTPLDADAQVNIGLVYNAMEKTDDAIRSFNAALEIDPENASFKPTGSIVNSSLFSKYSIALCGLVTILMGFLRGLLR